MIQKPFLKWVGGKTQIIEHIIAKFPSKFNNYHEIFLGGGSVLFAMLSLIEQRKIKIKGNIYAYDINEKLINVYNQIKTQPENVYNQLDILKKEYNSITSNAPAVNRNPQNKNEALTSREAYYYWIREQFNMSSTDNTIDAAYFIFLNKTCFRGLYRQGKKSGFNVPFGHYKTTPGFVSHEDILNISRLIKDVTFICCSFEESLGYVKKNDFAYLDPPYVPEKKNSFVGYNQDGFSFDKHKKLFDTIKTLKCNFLLSNSDSEMIYDTFSEKYTITKIEARRAIHSKNPETKTLETLIQNYEN